MQRDLMQAKFGNLPQLELTEEEEELDSLSSLSHPPPAAATRRHGKSKDYSALAANDYFDEALEVDYSSNRTTRVYYTPVVVPSTSSLPYNPATTLPTPATAPWLKPQTLLGDDNATGVLFVCVHGAGYSGLSYAGFAKEVLLQGRGRAGVLAYDSRGHGKLFPSKSVPHLELISRAV
jgi:protein phosphatase methylesterase 1